MTEAVERYWTALGFTTAVWAALENVLDMHVQLNRRHYKGITIEKSVPRGLDATLKFLRHAFSDLPMLAPHKEEMIRIIEAVDDLSKRRHLFIHGAAIHVSDAQDIPLSRVRGTKSTYVHMMEKTSVAEIYEVGHAAIALLRVLVTLAQILKAPFPGSIFAED